MKPVFELKSSRLDAFHIRLHSAKLDEIEALLKEKAEKFKLLNSKPFILDVSAIKSLQGVLLHDIVTLFKQHNFHIIALCHQKKDWSQYAQEAGILWLSNSKNTEKETEQSEDETVMSKETQPLITDSFEEPQPSDFQSITQILTRPTLVISTPIRTGQQVYAEQSDLIVLGMVSEGAEVIADGNIHIYAPMRGRALAGESGDKNARIFIQSMQAELVSIAGIYRVLEQNLPPSLHKQAVQIELQDGDRLVISAINAQ